MAGDLGLEQGDILGSVEKAAMAKVRDLNSGNFVVHMASLGKIRDILKEGLVAGNFARRIGKENYQSLYGYAVNEKYVSTMGGSEKIIGRPIIGWPGEVAVLIKGEAVAKEGQKHHFNREWLIKNRAAPRDFIGLGFDIVQINDKDFEANFALLIEIAKRAWSTNPQNALPVYSFTSGGLLWPKVMSHDDILEMVRGGSGIGGK